MIRVRRKPLCLARHTDNTGHQPIDVSRIKVELRTKPLSTLAHHTLTLRIAARHSGSILGEHRRTHQTLAQRQQHHEGIIDTIDAITDTAQ